MQSSIMVLGMKVPTSHCALTLINNFFVPEVHHVALRNLTQSTCYYEG